MVTQTRLEFALARELGMTHGDMMQRMTVAEFQSWMILFEVESKEHEAAMKSKGKK